MSTALPIKLEAIRVFPNSGHHIKFVPLLAYPDEHADQVYARMPHLKDRSEQFDATTRKRLEQECKKPSVQSHNSASATHPWIRYWFGVQERVVKGEPGKDEGDMRAKLMGVWIAVESNLGSRSRGYVTRVSTPPTQSELEQCHSSRSSATPYAYERLEDIDLDKGHNNFNLILNGDSGAEKVQLCQFPFQWVQPDGKEPIEVDLVIDFGNTRSAVLALEHLEAPSLAFAPICKPIPFHASDAVFEGHEGLTFDESTILFDSWFLLRQPRFSNPDTAKGEVADWQFVNSRETVGWGPFKRENPVTLLEQVNYRMPQMFVELSPALLGPSARNELLRLDLEHGANCFLSSPKRYAWDTDPCDGPGSSNWHMVTHEGLLTIGKFARIPNLQGELLRFMPADGSDWELDSPPTAWPPQQRPSRNPANPRYPRSDSLTWTAVAVIENAFRTINCEAWRRQTRPYGRRKLRHILVTYPSGWTASEVKAYRLKWQMAINIFAITHLEDPQRDIPKLVMPLDEAVASQLPVIIAEIRRMGDDGGSWIEVVGRGRGVDAKVRVMTIDIGGGTTDVSVVEYQDQLPGKGADLYARVLFKDTSTVAGDQLRKMLIERVLLPVVLGDRQGIDRKKFDVLFAGVQSSITAFATWARYTRLLFLPIVNRWLADLAANRQEPFTISDLFQTDEDGKVLDDFNLEAKPIVDVEQLLDRMAQLGLPKSAVERCVIECFSHPFQALAKHVAAFDCDLVIVSGKPSELPPIRNMLRELLPLLPSRLIFAHGFRAGAANWPLSADGRVHDAKFVTVVGAALYQAISCSRISGWSIRVLPDARMLTQNWWGIPAGHRFKPVLLKPGDEQNTTRMMVGATIGRKLLPGDTVPEPVYLLRWRDKSRRHGHPATLEVTLRRVAPPTPGEGESLEIIRARGVLEMLDADGRARAIPVTEDDVELKLCTLQQGEQYWLDTGRFEVQWPDELDK